MLTPSLTGTDPGAAYTERDYFIYTYFPPLECEWPQSGDLALFPVASQGPNILPGTAE